MVTLNFILENREKILQKAKVFGFEEVKLNADFGEGLLFIVEKGNNPKASANYAAFLRNSLENMLGCKMTVSEQTRLRAKHREEILENSISLKKSSEEILKFLISKHIETANIVFPEAKFGEKERGFYQSQEEEVQNVLNGQKQTNTGLRGFLSTYPRKRSATQLLSKESEEDKRRFIEEELLAESNKEIMRVVLLALPQTAFDEIQSKFKKARYSETLTL